MAVFVSVSDESSGANHLSDFQCTGWLAPEHDWSQFFAPAWQERVLDGPPKIQYLHVTEMRSRAWREKNGITRLDAENRLDQAAHIIATMGSLYPVKIKVAGPLFRKLFEPHQLKAASGGRKRYEPDYYAFVTYVYAVLCRVKIKFPEAEKVDFIVERKSTITRHIQEFYDSLPEALKRLGREDLVPLFGNFISATKEHISLQAADFLCWHSQRGDAGKLESCDIRRWNPMANKTGFNFSVPDELMTALAEAFQAKGADEPTDINGEIQGESALHFHRKNLTENR